MCTASYKLYWVPPNRHIYGSGKMKTVASQMIVLGTLVCRKARMLELYQDNWINKNHICVKIHEENQTERWSPKSQKQYLRGYKVQKNEGGDGRVWRAIGSEPVNWESGAGPSPPTVLHWRLMVQTGYMNRPGSTCTISDRIYSSLPVEELMNW